MSLSAFDAVFFDLHGTLTVPRLRENENNPADTLIPAIARFGIDTSGLEADTVNSELWRKPAVPATEDATAFQHRLAQYVNDKCGASLAPSVFRDVADAICAKWQTGFNLDSECRTVLGQLAEAMPLGLVSNFDHPPHVRRLLSDLELLDLFETIVISGEVGVEKPDPRILQLACERLHVSPERCAYVGDASVDYDAATAAGMYFFWIRRPEIQQWIAERTGGKYSDSDAELLRLGETGAISVIESLAELASGESPGSD